MVCTFRAHPTRTATGGPVEKLARYSEATPTIPMQRIPVFVGTRIVEMADSVRVRVLLGAPNAEVLRKRKTGIIVQINLLPLADESRGRAPREDSRVAHYEEHLEPAPIPMLKIIGDDGSMRRWDDADAFNPRRFNPDSVARTAMELARP